MVCLWQVDIPCHAACNRPLVSACAAVHSPAAYVRSSAGAQLHRKGKNTGQASALCADCLGSSRCVWARDEQHACDVIGHQLDATGPRMHHMQLRTSIVSGRGPMKTMPSSPQRRAKAAFSLMNPYPARSSAHRSPPPHTMVLQKDVAVGTAREITYYSNAKSLIHDIRRADTFPISC